MVVFLLLFLIVWIEIFLLLVNIVSGEGNTFLFFKYELKNFVKLSFSWIYYFNNKVVKERFFFIIDIGILLLNLLISFWF